MRSILLPLFLLLVVGCSSGANEPVVPNDELPPRVTLSNPYTEYDSHYIDVIIEGVPVLYQFSMRFEYNPRCIELNGFEPSDDFGPESLMLFEKLGHLPDELKADLSNSENGLVAIAISRPYPHMGDIEAPGFLGRIRFKQKCDDSGFPVRIFNRPEYLVFRDHNRNRIDVKPAETFEYKGGDQ